MAVVSTNIPIPADPLVDLSTGHITRMWYQLLVTLWERTGAQAGSQSAALDLIGDVRGGMLGRFSTAWQEFVATASEGQIPILRPSQDPDLLTLTQLLDSLGTPTAIGNILFRSNTGWDILVAGPNDTVLTSRGPGNDPVYASPTAQAALPATIATGVTATGTNQATALALSRQWSVVSTVAGGTGVIIFNTQTGTETRIWNDGANSLSVYPPVGGQVDAQGTNNPYPLPAGASQIISKLSATSWRTQQLG